MKFLLVEPGTDGHRLVILGYVKKILRNLGHEYYEAHPKAARSVKQILDAARAHQCEVIYLLTLDGLTKNAFLLSLLSKEIKVIGNYYLYTNLFEGWKSYLWRFLLLSGRFAKIMISDQRMLGATIKYPKEVIYLPDPWDPTDFRLVKKEDARNALNLPLDCTVFLLFGSLDQRKGVHTFLEFSKSFAAQKVGKQQIVFLFSGKLAQNLVHYEEMLKHAQINYVSWRFFNTHIPENLVSLHFCASDYVVCPYPRKFRVSSGTVTRALASQRPILVTPYGVNSTLVRESTCGMLLPDSISGWGEVISEAAEICAKQSDEYRLMACACAQESTKRSLDQYQEYFRKAVNDL